MFKFLRRDETPKLIAECDAELERTARASHQFVSVPQDVKKRSDLLQRAATAGLSEHQTIKRLEFLHRLLAALTADVVPDVATQERLLAEARVYQLQDTSGARALREHLQQEELRVNGPRVVSRDAHGRSVYLQCDAEFKNKPGRLEVRDDGLTFSGEVLVEIAWSNVAHAAKTTHTYQGCDFTAVALQEGKRRSPTKFAFTSSEADYACEVTLRVWQQSRQQPGGSMKIP